MEEAKDILKGAGLAAALHLVFQGILFLICTLFGDMIALLDMFIGVVQLIFIVPAVAFFNQRGRNGIGTGLKTVAWVVFGFNVAIWMLWAIARSFVLR